MGRRAASQRRKPDRTAIWLLDEAGERRAAFDLGEVVFLTGHGLRPGEPYDVELASGAGERPELLARLQPDRYGVLPPTAILPFLGLTDPEPSEAGGFLTFEEGTKRWGGRKAQVRVRRPKSRFPATSELSVAKRLSRPVVHFSDEEGRLVTGLEEGRSDIHVALRGFPGGCVRVYLVARQYDWQVGDPIEPVIDATGAPLMVAARLAEGETTVLPVWAADRVRSGSYQLIARSYLPGWYLAEELTLQPEDVLSNRRITSLVVRRDLYEVKAVIGGCVNTPDVAGRPLGTRPYFQFVNNFPRGTDVWAALDPGGLPPGLVSQRAALYVIQHKTAAQWAASTALTDVSGPGGAPAVEIVPIVSGCINCNRTLVWPNPQTAGRYDLVVDFGNNAPNPAAFATDASFDTPLDMIDGYFRVGFYITEDPGAPGPFAGAIGRHDYNLGTVTLRSSPTVPAQMQTLPVKATVRYPAQSTGIDAPFQAGTFPLALMMHGNSGVANSFEGYTYLLEHLAGHGFIAMSVHADPGMMIEVRARGILHHLGVMLQRNTDPGVFQGHVDLGNIGIMGHSRGGEAVIRAARINADEGLGWNLKSGINLAGTDFHHFGSAGIPLLTVYGANDGDVAGWWPDHTGFNNYDESSRPRSLVFVYGATHNRFNELWGTEGGTLVASDVPNLVSTTAHRDVMRGYATAFLQMHCQGLSEQVEYFTGALKPAAVSALQVHTSHQEPGGRVLDDFEQVPPDPSANTLGGPVASGSLVSPPAEDALRTLDSHSPHVTSGVRFAWNISSGTYLSTLPAGQRDVSGFAALSFRVTQRYGSVQNPAGQAQDLYVRLTDGAGNSRAIRAGAFADVPFPYERGYTDHIKSALKTVRIPLASFVVAAAGAAVIDLTDVVSVGFDLSARPTGEVEVDDIEFGF